MYGALITLDSDQDDDFEKVACPVGSDHEPTIGIVPSILDDHRVVDGMYDIVVGYAMAASGRGNLHRNIVLRKEFVRA